MLLRIQTCLFVFTSRLNWEIYLYRGYHQRAVALVEVKGESSIEAIADLRSLLTQVLETYCKSRQGLVPKLPPSDKANLAHHILSRG